MSETERNMMKECHTCVSRRSVPGNCHIRCADPDKTMTGHKRGIEMGWFIYPQLFDPVWKTSLCKNFERNKITD